MTSATMDPETRGKGDSAELVAQVEATTTEPPATSTAAQPPSSDVQGQPAFLDCAIEEEPDSQETPRLQAVAGPGLAQHRSFSNSTLRSARSSVSAVSVNGSDAASITNAQAQRAAPAAMSSSSRDLASSEAQAQPPGEAGKKSDRNATSRNQPNRSRSRVQRRFSSSTGGASSHHSPSGERGAGGRPDKEEHKPAPKPSRNILNRLIQHREFDVCVFGDKVILDEEIENWPICDYLISFYSHGFPLDKAMAYVKARKPFCVNDLPMQRILWDRRVCLRLLDRIGVPTPPRIEVNRDGGPGVLTPDLCKYIRDVSGVSFDPVGSEAENLRSATPRRVELPTSGEDHNIIIYFPSSDGGGARKLFRKVGNKSSEFVEGLTVPRAISQPNDSFIYESFMQVDNAEDVKAYTVGPAYCHAETRKSPVVDGVVRRNTHGKEVRYVTALSSEEKEIASKISTAFGQRVCGFDLLRTGGKSYVIDVNGWSFVKDNDDYYDHCASILRDIFMKEKLRRDAARSNVASPTSDADSSRAAAKDRDLASQGRPSQKYKFTFHTAPFIRLLRGHQEEVLLIGEPALASVLDAVDEAFAEGVEDPAKLKALRNVLIKKGSWAGTKVQIKPMFRKKQKPEKKEQAQDEAVVQTDEDADAKDRPGPRSKRTDSLSGLIVKWGGEPTHSARYQAQELGENMRSDLELMNRDVLNEVHIFSSSERRVVTSAQIWAASFLRMKDLPEDFITIRKDLLDDSNAAKDEMDKVKKKLKGLLRKGNERPPQFAWPDKMPEPSEVQTRVVQLMNFHRRVMQHNYAKLHAGANGNGNNGKSSSGNNGEAAGAARWCCGEDAELFRERWEKLFAEFCDGEKVDPSKISELYDTMKFDALHNRQFLEWVFTPPSSMLAEEYGMLLNGKDGAKQQPPAPKDKDSAVDDRFDDKSDMSAHHRAVKRIFHRRSFLNGLRSSGEAELPEKYFHLQRGNSQTKAKTDARFEPLRELYQLAKVLFDFICPQEYGISDSEKLEIGLLTSLPLLKEIVEDLEDMQASDDAKSFIYFTKESHIYTLLNCILEGGLETKIKRATIPELDYLSQISFELYEMPANTPAKSKEGREGDDAEDTDAGPAFNYSIKITISPGCHVFDPLDVQLDSRHCIGCAPRRSLTAHADWKKVIETLRAKFHQVKLPKTFLAINLSDAFTFQEKQHQAEAEGEEKATDEKDGEEPTPTPAADADAAGDPAIPTKSDDPAPGPADEPWTESEKRPLGRDLGPVTRNPRTNQPWPLGLPGHVEGPERSAWR
ncbi:hypothetical protein VTJ83DRAFT_4165 [Remersonia thermophila]|uniref:Inositol hexakisphosphate and diphosphoinositol-pentakisphosphate kinase n=1 Tax=Remersonia thermophila TaxID=72144 RepID=A0ABR4D940_9PEZI